MPPRESSMLSGHASLFACIFIVSRHIKFLTDLDAWFSFSSVHGLGVGASHVVNFQASVAGDIWCCGSRRMFMCEVVLASSLVHVHAVAGCCVPSTLCDSNLQVLDTSGAACVE